MSFAKSENRDKIKMKQRSGPLRPFFHNTYGACVCVCVQPTLSVSAPEIPPQTEHREKINQNRKKEDPERELGQHVQNETPSADVTPAGRLCVVRRVHSPLFLHLQQNYGQLKSNHNLGKRTEQG